MRFLDFDAKRSFERPNVKMLQLYLRRISVFSCYNAKTEGERTSVRDLDTAQTATQDVWLLKCCCCAAAVAAPVLLAARSRLRGECADILPWHDTLTSQKLAWLLASRPAAHCKQRVDLKSGMMNEIVSFLAWEFLLVDRSQGKLC